MSVWLASWFNYMQRNTDEALRPRRSFLEPAMFTSFILAKVRAYLKHRESQREWPLTSGRELDGLDLARFHDLHR